MMRYRVRRSGALSRTPWIAHAAALVVLELSLCYVVVLGGCAPDRRDLHILVTNDDGVDADGLSALSEQLSSLGRVTVFAPAEDQSGVGQLSTRGPVRVSRSEPGGIDRFAVVGTPVDAVRIGILYFRASDAPVDLVVSGINNGSNVGSLAHFSGTVGAAIEATRHGVPAIAVSQNKGESNYALASRIAKEMTIEVIERGLSPGVLLSINIPSAQPGQLRGMLATRMGGLPGRYEGVEVVTGHGEDSFHARPWIRMEPVDDTATASKAQSIGPGCVDTDAFASGYVTVTPIGVDWTDHATLRWLEPGPLPRLVGELNTDSDG